MIDASYEYSILLCYTMYCTVPFSWILYGNYTDNCSALQTVQSMELDPKTGWMWIIDAGVRNGFTDSPVTECPPKLVVYDTVAGEERFRHVFPDEVLGWETNYVNDIVVDPVDGKWAYMSDTGVNSQTGKF